MNRYRNLLYILVCSLLFIGCTSTTEEPQPVRFHYNDKEQLSEIIGPGKRKTELTYNPRGQIQTVNNGEEEQHYEYNSLGLLKSFTDHTGKTKLQYDTNGRLQEMAYPRQDKIGYQYNEKGKITSLTWGDKHFLRYQRDLAGNPVKIETPAGDFKGQYDYDLNP